MLECIESELGTPVTCLKVDGGLSNSDLTMQLQSDIIGLAIERPVNREMTSVGAAVVAGIGAGLWPSIDDVPSLNGSKSVQLFKSTLSAENANDRYQRWMKQLFKEME